jgi:hypothetical protein
MIWTPPSDQANDMEFLQMHRIERDAVRPETINWDLRAEEK